ncbi:alpha/beta fold hydrolase [Photobacterium aphoticum]|uniref:Lysophospholipase n=1 Tax=Photobacterium aphoticum TaxID=754436 RepID=A0A0J1JHY4_9GAMM|nr:alpha/beta fold hydrolase [Photobacterium aphoticum]KLV01557.1 lysophospholipase [Photobacterium aphoticum]PSU52707.1 lysophospholipase [Photobacterium aphoticum]GHA43406.1 lysophospholipase L2 [Photobacterium aphoticum]
MTAPATHIYDFTQESHFLDTLAGPAATLWHAREEGHFSGVDGCRIGWMALTAAHHKKAIVVVNGRIESYWKYQELFYDLFQQGYDIYALDHRGQGVSGRLAADTELGHVEQFSDYVTDLTTFYTEVVAPKNYRHRHLLAHSMGGTIASLFLAAFPETLTSAVLSAPMHGIAIKNWMRPIASPLARVVEQFQRQPGYAPGQMPYYPKPFADNPLSHSAVRYQWFRDLYHDHPELRIGGPSARWVWQGLAAANLCVSQAGAITTPVLILQAGADTIVDNAAQHRFCQAMQQAERDCQLITIEGARHELLFESDGFRNPSLQAALAHFRKAEIHVR